MLIRKNLIILAGIVALAIISASCSYVTPFNLKNLSGKPIVVTYSVSQSHYLLSQQLIKVDEHSGESIYVPIPDDRINVNHEELTVEIKMLPNEEIQLFAVASRMDNDYERDFDIPKLRVAGEDGSISLEGRKVFESFRPIRKSWYKFGPDIVRFVFEYR
jgi:hypothetical protein